MVVRVKVSFLNSFAYIRHFYKHRKLAEMVLMPTLYSHVFAISSWFAPHDVSKYEIRFQVLEDYMSRLQTSLVLLILNGTAKAKLAILAF